MSETFGQYLTRRREEAGLSQDELAGRIGLTSTYVRYLERESGPTGVGAGMRPMLEVVIAIAEALNVPLAEVRRAAGYDDMTDDSAASCESVSDTFDGSDFAAFQRMHEQLNAEGRRSFRPVLEMVRRELESLLRAQGVEREDRPAARRRGLNAAPRARPPHRQARG